MKTFTTCWLKQPEGYECQMCFEEKVDHTITTVYLPKTRLRSGKDVTGWRYAGTDGMNNFLPNPKGYFVDFEDETFTALVGKIK